MTAWSFTPLDLRRPWSSFQATSSTWMFVMFGAVLAACTSSSSAAGSACTSAAGRCVLGSVICSKEAPTSAQDCNPDESPGGELCCLDPAEGSPGSQVDGGGRDALVEGDSSTTGPSACSWPAILDRPDAYTTQCFAMAVVDACTGSADGGCESSCKATEYIVICGGPGPATPPPIPSGCRELLTGPGGHLEGCCPCGS